nr:hypothetical protein StreXyl84_37410 [Streptomyces sp. Xyl84]
MTRHPARRARLRPHAGRARASKPDTPGSRARSHPHPGRAGRARASKPDTLARPHARHPGHTRAPRGASGTPVLTRPGGDALAPAAATRPPRTPGEAVGTRLDGRRAARRRESSLTPPLSRAYLS